MFARAAICDVSRLCAQFIITATAERNFSCVLCVQKYHSMPNGKFFAAFRQNRVSANGNFYAKKTLFETKTKVEISILLKVKIS